MMLTKAEALSDVKDGLVIPDKLIKSAHGHYVGLATDMLRIYREGIGVTRGELHEAIEVLFRGESDCPARRIAAFCRLLDDESEYDGAEGDAAARLRMEVFSRASAKYPIVQIPETLLEHSEAAVKSEIATALERPWKEIERDLFGDVFDLHRLESFTGYETPEALLTRYNEAQLQAVLYNATELRIAARADYKIIVRAAKFRQLMHTATRKGDGFEFLLDGPASLHRETQRYGVWMAGVIPTLLLCKDWDLRASIRRFKGSKWQPSLVVSSKDKYRSSLKAFPEFDSELERVFTEKWGTEPREGWTLKRESEPRFAGQKAFFPDFTFYHSSGVQVLFEIVGHWTPEYLAEKKKTLEMFRDEPLLLAVREDSAESFGDLGVAVFAFKSSIKLEPVLAALGPFLAEKP
jgi:predicted nuclease of restriction endonuclease-like RecB superfamily